MTCSKYVMWNVLLAKGIVGTVVLNDGWKQNDTFCLICTFLFLPATGDSTPNTIVSAGELIVIAGCKYKN